MLARVIGVLLGLGIAWSSVWEPPGSAVLTHDLVLGLVIAAVALVGLAVRGVNYVNTALALWMFFSGILFPVVPHIYVGIVGGTLLVVSSLVSRDDRTFWPFGARARLGEAR